VQSVSDRQSVQNDRNRFEHFPLNPSAALHKSTNPNYRLSETVAYRRPPSIFVEQSRGSENGSSSAREGRGAELGRVGDGELFECRCCQSQKDGCQFCSDLRVIKGNSNIIKFFEYVISFKMGISQSYGQKRLASTATRKSVNQFCSDFYNNRTETYNSRTETHSQYSIRESDLTRTDRLSIRSKKCARSDLGKELVSMAAVHENYCCDVCHVSPIVGSRYHCSECEDYDECEQCHGRVGHRHLMEKIDKSGRARQMESMVQMLAQPTARTSLKAPLVIKKSIDAYSATTRSALR
jgi:hypothetical protein